MWKMQGEYEYLNDENNAEVSVSSESFWSDCNGFELSKPSFESAMMIKFQFENNVVHGLLAMKYYWFHMLFSTYVMQTAAGGLSIHGVPSSMIVVLSWVCCWECCEGSSPFEISHMYAVLNQFGWVVADHV